MQMFACRKCLFKNRVVIDDNDNSPILKFPIKLWERKHDLINRLVKYFDINEVRDVIDVSICYIVDDLDYLHKAKVKRILLKLGFKENIISLKNCKCGNIVAIRQLIKLEKEMMKEYLSDTCYYIEKS
jgi:hypothetical protein